MPAAGSKGAVDRNSRRGGPPKISEMTGFEEIALPSFQACLASDHYCTLFETYHPWEHEIRWASRFVIGPRRSPARIREIGSSPDWAYILTRVHYLGKALEYFIKNW